MPILRNGKLRNQISIRTPEQARRTRVSIQADLEKGNANERRVKEALDILTERGIFHHYLRVRWGSKTDVDEGIDFFVFVTRRWALPLQVKSSFTGRKLHHDTHGTGVPCIVVEALISP